MSTPPPSIEEVAKRVKELAAGGSSVSMGIPGVAEYRTLAPQLAEWVEKALPVIEAARAAGCMDCEDSDEYRRLKAALVNLDTPSSLAAEGTTE